MTRRLLALLVAVLAAAVLAPAGLALTCPNVPVTERLDEVDGAFVGTLLSERPDPAGDGAFLYRFAVVEALKGADRIGSQIEVRSDDRLVSKDDEPLAGFEDVEVGVMLSFAGPMPATSSCDLAPPLDLVAAFDEPRGNAIKVVIGMILLLLVLTFAIVRLKRKQRRLDAGAAGPPDAPSPQ